MPIYKITDKTLSAIDRTTFAKEGIRELQDLQNMIKSQIEVLSPDTLIVAEEFCDWQDSRRRIDLLGIDKDANQVVIELKRTEDGGYMDLQAIRYASMISTLTFSKLVEVYEGYLENNDIGVDATECLLEFLEWNEPDEEAFAQEVTILLASAEFSKELTTSVMWLNDFGLSIRCVRMHPYINNGEVLLDIQTVLPVAETADYQIKIQEKKQSQRAARKSSRDTTKYDVSVGKEIYHSQTKRWMVFYIVKNLIDSGIHPTEIIDAISYKKNRLFLDFEGTLDSENIKKEIMKNDTGVKNTRIKRYFYKDENVFHTDGRTYVLTNQWGRRTLEAVDDFTKAFPKFNINIEPIDD